MSDITIEFVEAYLSRRWGEKARVSVLKRFARGISRETWSVVAERNGVKEELVLRRDLDGNSIGTEPLRFEYDVYLRLQKSGVPVAPLLWWEDSEEWGAKTRPFYLRRLVDGAWDIPGYGDPGAAGAALRLAVAKEHISKLALVHGCDWRAFGFGDILPVPGSNADCARVAVERMFADLARFQFSPLPIFLEVKEWLLDHAPVAPRICLLKGTNGLGEEIFRDGKIVAMSDWEQTSLGDPASDLARTQDFTQSISIDGKEVWGLAQALDYYETLTGVRVPMSSIQYYGILTLVENIITLHHGAAPAAHGERLELRPTWLAAENIHVGQRYMLAAVTGRAPNTQWGT
jgi:aminoglycoside phosphotransferase (APT) family kinase protein